MLVGVVRPCIYTAVRCGSSGHNIRVDADLDSPAIGMVVIGNQLTAIRQVSLLLRPRLVLTIIIYCETRTVIVSKI